MTGPRSHQAGAEFAFDIVVVGGTTGGIGAALAIGSLGGSCLVIEETDWLGGQLTSQGVPPDENRWIEEHGASKSYLEFRRRIRRWYREHESLTPEALGDPLLNPGGGWVSRLCFSPRIGARVIDSMLAPHEAASSVTVWRESRVERIETDGDTVRCLHIRDAQGCTRLVHPRIVIDATDTGDVLDLASVEHSIGSDARSRFDELHAPENADPLDQQACTWCFALEHQPGEDHTGSVPDGYADWSTYIPDMEPGWTGPLFSWTVPSHNEQGRLTLPLVPTPATPPEDQLELWRYRRIVDAASHTDARTDVSLMNCVQIDGWRKPLLGVEPEAKEAALELARQQSLCFLHWMRTDAPRHDGGSGYPGLVLAGEELGTNDGFAKSVYIREPRRLEAQLMLNESHVGFEQRRLAGCAHMNVVPEGSSEPFDDSVGIGHYPIDLHPSCSGRNAVYIPACPFRIPLRSLLPKRCSNLLAGGKCLGVSHVANGCTRLHPVEWNIGEAAGVAAVHALRHGGAVSSLSNPQRTAEIQRDLRSLGVRLRWPWEQR